MYEAMRTRAPNSTRITGLSVAVLATALAGYGLASGLVMDFIAPPPPVTQLAPLDPKKELPPPDELLEIRQTDDLYVPPKFDLPDFERDAPPPAAGTGVVMGTDGGSGSGMGGAMAAPAPAAKRIGPKMRPGPEPPYPPESRRAEEQGDTGLKVCVSASGRVTAAEVASSSGFPRLDAAALKWVREARFHPGTVGGVAQDMCNHSVVYEWNFELLCVDENATGKEDKLKPCPRRVR